MAQEKYTGGTAPLVETDTDNSHRPYVLTQTPTGTYTDRSGTITTGGTSQQLAAANTARKMLFIQNQSTGSLWVNFGTAAVQGQPSIEIPAGSTLSILRGVIPIAAVNIIGATTGQAFAAKEA